MASNDDIKILVVDDEVAVREILVEILSQEGYRLSSAADGGGGLETFRRESPDIVITDVYMPNMDGLELLARVRKESPETISAVMTGFG